MTPRTPPVATGTDDVDTIIAKLTKAQRAAVLWASGKWKELDRTAPRHGSFRALQEVRKGNPRTQIARIYSLVDIDAVRIVSGKWAPRRVSLTPLGLRVRARLAAHPHTETGHE